MSLKSVAKCLPFSNNLSCCCEIQSSPPLLSITTTIGLFSVTESEFYGVYGNNNININTKNKDIDFIINSIRKRI